MIELDERRALELTTQLLETGVSPQSILNTCQQALRVVGERYERQEYFISGLIMAGELFTEVLDLAQPAYPQSSDGTSAGTIILGTVAKDIHDIGKNLFAMTLKGFGFEVIDLGVDVSPERFLEQTLRSQPDVICLSGLIIAAIDSMRDTVRLIRAAEKELGYRPPVVLGGVIVDGRACEHAGADSWSTDAMEGMRLCQKLVARAKG